jgi:fructose-1,6-bisphosphatase/inositol monophosphatase family enzyme
MTVIEAHRELMGILVERCADVATFIQQNKGRIVTSNKETFGTIENVSFNSIVTNLDVFTQDFFACCAIRHKHKIYIYGEEDGIGQSTTNVSKGMVLLVDPIDGTKWFSSGSPDYSCLITLLDKGVPAFAIGLFPETLKGYTCDGEQVQPFALRRERVTFGKPIMPPKRNLGGVACHYRLTNAEFSHQYAAITSKFGDSDFNGRGFGTNLTFVEKAFRGEYNAFIAPKMGIVDGFPTALFLKSIGWKIQFFNASIQGKSWERTKAWSYADFGELGKLRGRYVAAVDNEYLAKLVNVLIPAENES